MDAQLTLREGIAEFNRINAELFGKRGSNTDANPEAKPEVSQKAKDFFRCHDTAHVVFGCDTSLFGEGMVKMWTISGTTLGFWAHLTGYQEADAFALFLGYSFPHVMANIGKIMGNIPSVFMRAHQMTKPWPWDNHQNYMDMSLEQIRQEFNIKPIS